MEKYHTEVNGKALHSHCSWERLAKSGGQEGNSECKAWKELERQKLPVVIKRKMTDEK